MLSGFRPCLAGYIWSRHRGAVLWRFKHGITGDCKSFRSVAALPPLPNSALSQHQKSGAGSALAPEPYLPLRFAVFGAGSSPASVESASFKGLYSLIWGNTTLDGRRTVPGRAEACRWKAEHVENIVPAHCETASLQPFFFWILQSNAKTNYNGH